MEGGGNAEILTMIFSDDMTYMVYNVNVKLRLSRIFYVSLHVMKWRAMWDLNIFYV